METAVIERAIEQQYKRLFHEALYILKQPHDAEDAVQNACLKAWSCYPYTAVSACEGWLKVIVYHECITILRNRTKSGLPFEMESIYFLAETEDHWSGFFEKQSITDLVNSLPVKYASVIKLRYYEGMEIREIACQLHQPTGTVRSHLFRARQMLRNKFCEANKVLA